MTSKDKSAKPIWLSSYNLLNLLNLPRMMKLYGHIRNLWEGGVLGEEILKHVKPNIPNVITNWHIASTKKFINRNQSPGL